MQVKADLLHLRPIPQYIMLLKISAARIGLEELQVHVGWEDMHILSSLIEKGFLESRNLCSSFKLDRLQISPAITYSQGGY
jgi:hypothetical protein